VFLYGLLLYDSQLAAKLNKIALLQNIFSPNFEDWFSVIYVPD